jgi:hypothetical protein
MTATTSSARGAHAAPAGNATLRAMMESRRQAGQRFSLDETMALLVPLCLEVKQRHDQGLKLYVHPSCITVGHDGMIHFDAVHAVVPTNSRDRVCLAPELQQRLEPGDARASVFSMGAICYELLTGQTIGPAMRRPHEIVPELPEQLDLLLAKALVGDPPHRPDDLGALASAMHHLAPKKSIPPPDADESHLDRTGDYDVDVKLSMMPPPPAVPIDAADVDPFGRVSQPAVSRPSNDLTARLSMLKARLEADPRPRYVVTKDRMDHGPFTAVELLQQIASNSFKGNETIRDEISGQNKALLEWEEFAPFADQARVHREIVQEKKEVAEVVEQEKRAGLAKSTIGIAIVVALIAVGGVFFLIKKGFRNDDQNIEDDNTFSLDPAGSIKGQARKKAGGGGRGGGGGGVPGGMSYEEAMNKFGGQEMNIGGPAAGPDLTDAQLQGPINARMPGILGSCGAGAITVKIAIKNGAAIGVTSSPPNACVNNGVRSIQWPANPKTDSLTTSW